MRIEQDDWEDWQAHPLTEALMRALKHWEEEAKGAWVAASWGSGTSDPVLLARMRERAKAFEELRSLSKETLEEAI